MVAPAGKTHVMGDVVTDDVAVNFICVPGHAVVESAVTFKTGFGATTIDAPTGLLQ